MSTEPTSLDIAAQLRRVPLFSELNDEDLSRVVRHVLPRRLSRGEVLFQRGDPARGFYCVSSGQIKLAFSSAQGNEKIVEVIGPDQSFGEAVFFLDRPYPVFAEALRDSQVLFVGREAIFDQIEGNAGFARKLLAGLSIRLHGLIRDVETYSLRSSQQRVIGYLLQQVPEDATGGDIVLPTSKQVIASRLNLTPETLSRIFHELSEAGLIVVAGKHVTVPDLARLRQHEG